MDEIDREKRTLMRKIQLQKKENPEFDSLSMDAEVEEL